MCRSIKVLRRPAEPATREEISAAALQFVRKVSGYRKPSRANEKAFDKAVIEVAGSVEKLLGLLAVNERESTRIQKSSAEAVELAVLRSDDDASLRDGRRRG
jgi:hypothetical protein